MSGSDPEEEYQPGIGLPEHNDEAAEDARIWLQTITRHTQRFRELCCNAPPADRLKLELPEELPKAWLHLVMSLVVCTKDLLLFENQMMICYELLEEGMRKVVQSFTNKSLLEYTVFMPFDLASLISCQLLQDLTRTYPDISETYRQYLRRLVSCAYKYYRVITDFATGV
jgi:hypothetical protein